MAKLQKIPVGACILWDRMDSPPVGWDEVILGGRFVRIGAGLGFGGADTQSHSHGVSASSGQETYSSLVGEDYDNTQTASRNLASKPHTHPTSGSASSYGSAYEPEHTIFRIFKNTDVNRDEFPLHAIVFYDNAAMPPGWLSLGTATYIKADTTNVGVYTPFIGTAHNHSVAVSLNAPANPCFTDNEFDEGSKWDDCNHQHSAFATSGATVISSWTMNQVSIGFIKQTSLEGNWDNDAAAYLYCLFDATTSPDPFTDVTYLYTNRFLYGGGAAPAISNGNNGSHTHTVSGSLISGYTNQLGYFGPGFPLGVRPPSNSVEVHTHPVSVSMGAGGSFPSPLYRDFKLIRVFAAGYQDIGIRYKSANGTVYGIGVEALKSTHKIRVKATDGNVYGIPRLDVSNPFASHVKLHDGSAYKFLPRIDL